MSERIASVYLMRLDPTTIGILSGRKLELPDAVFASHLAHNGLEYALRDQHDNEYVHKAIKRRVRDIVRIAKHVPA